VQGHFRVRTLAIKVLFSAAFLTVLFLYVRRSDLVATFRRIDPLFFALSLLLAFVLVPLNSLKWKVLLRQHGDMIGLMSLMRMYLIGYFFSNLLPSRIGGDVVRSYYVGRRIDNQSQAAVSVFAERFSGFILLLPLVILAPLMVPRLYTHVCVVLPACAALLLLPFVVWMCKVRTSLNLLDRAACGVFSLMRSVGMSVGLSASASVTNRLERLHSAVFKSLESFQEKLVAMGDYLRSDRRQLLVVAGLTVLFYIVALFNVYVSFRAFGVEPDLLEMSAVVPSIMIVSMLPVAVLGNLGFTEGVYVAFFGLIGVNSAVALAMGLLLRIKLLVLGGVGFLFYLSYRHRDGDIAGSSRLAAEKP